MRKGGRRGRLFYCHRCSVGEFRADQFEIDDAIAHRAPVAHARRGNVRGVAVELIRVLAEAGDGALAQLVAQKDFRPLRPFVRGGRRQCAIGVPDLAEQTPPFGDEVLEPRADLGAVGLLPLDLNIGAVFCIERRADGERAQHQGDGPKPQLENRAPHRQQRNGDGDQAVDDRKRGPGKVKILSPHRRGPDTQTKNIGRNVALPAERHNAGRKCTPPHFGMQ